MSLAEQIGTKAASEKLNIPYSTVEAWVGGWRSAGALQMYHEGRAQLADCFERAAWESLSLAREKAPEAPYKDVVRGAALATDKMLVLRGKPSVISSSTNTNANISVNELLRLATPEQLELLLPLLEAASHAIPVVANTVASTVEVGGTRTPEASDLRETVLADPESGP